MTYSPLPLIAVLFPLIGAVLILAAGSRRANLRELCTMLASAGQFASVFAMIPQLVRGQTLTCTMVPLGPALALELRVDPFGMIFALLSSFLWIVVSVYSIGYMRSLQEHAQTRFYFCFAMSLAGASGVALSGNLLTLYMFYEILTVATFPLVAHKETPEAIRAARKYLVYLLGGAVFVLFAIAATYYLTGSLDFVAGGFVGGRGSADFLRVIFAAFIIGFGAKAAIMPLHEWLPSAMVAPTPVSALLHAVAVVKAGVFCCLRVILYVYGPGTLADLALWTTLAAVVSCTVIVANLFALTQDNLKRRLAFSTINNLAVIILADHSIVHPAIRALRLGVEDYLLKPLQVKDLEAALTRSVRRRAARLYHRDMEGWHRAEVEARAQEAARRQKELEQVSVAVLSALIRALEAKSSYFKGHSEAVARLAETTSTRAPLPMTVASGTPPSFPTGGTGTSSTPWCSAARSSPTAWAWASRT